MLRSEVEAALERRPFKPLTIYLDDGRKVEVPFAHVAIPFARYLMFMQGVKSETSRSATGKIDFPYERIDRIAERRRRAGEGRRRAS